ncbi:NifU family protein [Candidatus Margulisiibacteriota bacterium]
MSQKEKGKNLENRIKSFIETDIKPILAMDGGDVTFCGFDDGIVKVQLLGACKGCPGATMTLKMGIEQRLKEAIPEVKEVIQV